MLPREAGYGELTPCYLAGEGTWVPFTWTMAVIGEQSVIHPQVYIGENVKVGKDCILYPA